MSSLEIYHETIYWRLILLLIAAIDIPLLGALYYSLAASPSADPYETLFPIILIAAVTAVVVSFSRFSVVMTTSGIAAGFGVSKGRFRWDEVVDCYADEASAMRYGGFGIKGGVYQGRKRLVYSVTGAGRVVLRVRGRKYDEFVFSTRSPEQVMRIIRTQTGKPAV